MSASVTFTILNKENHIAYRDSLQNTHKLCENSITELTNTRRGLLAQQQPTAVANITLGNAVMTLNNYRHNVDAYNIKCQRTKNDITGNNNALRQLLDRINSEIEQVKARKAAADAAAAVAAEEAAALENAKESLQVYIASLQSQLDGINENNIDDIARQIESSADAIRTLGAGYSDALLSDEAISQNTKNAITVFKADTVKEVDSNTSIFDTLKVDFETAKNTIAAALIAKSRALQSVANGANVKADAIQTALGPDKQNPIDDEGLGKIKNRAAELATQFEETALLDIDRKNQINQMIATDMAAFEENRKITEEYQKIMDIFDSTEFKVNEEAIRQYIMDAKMAEKAVADEKGTLTAKSQANTRFGEALTGLNKTILLLEGHLQKSNSSLREKLQYLQKTTSESQPPPIEIAQIQGRLKEIISAKDEYKRLIANQQALGLKPAPPPTPPSYKNPRHKRQMPPTSDDDNADPTSTPIEPTRTPGRRYSIFIPTPTQQTKRPKPVSRREAAAAVTGDIAEDTIDPTVLEIFVYEDAESASAGASAAEMDSSSKRGGGGGGGRRRGVLRSQRGGAPKVAKIIKVSEITPEIQTLFLSFKSPSDVLGPDFLKKIEEHASSKIIAIPQDIDNEMTKVKPDELIYSTDDTPFFENLGQKASHKTTIDKLMLFLDNDSVTASKNGKTYRYMYLILWQFMEYDSGSIAVLRSVFDVVTDDTSQLLSPTQSGITQRRKDLTWSGPTDNELFNILFMELSKCYNSSGNDDGTYSRFLETQVARKGKQKYRFMLNWTFLIAFHLYYARYSQAQNRSGSEEYGILLGKFIEDMYHTFIGWMEQLDSSPLKNLFIPVSQTSLTYKSGVKKRIDSDIKTDATSATLTPDIIKDIRIFLCNNGEKGKREKHLSVKPTTRRVMPAKRGTQAKHAWSPAPPSEPYPDHSDSDSESGSDSETEPKIRPPASNLPLFRRVVPQLKLQSLASASSSSSSLESKAQSARGSRGTLQPHIPPFATSRKHADANKNADGNTLPKYAGSEPAVSTTTTPKPPLRPLSPGTAENIRNMTFTRRIRHQPPSESLSTGKGTKGGGKRTRKHRSVPSSVPVPAPATRRRHYSSSSSQKHTRRQRRASIRT